MPPQFRPSVEHPGGCYTCRYFGERVDVAVLCGAGSYRQLRLIQHNARNTNPTRHGERRAAGDPR